MNRIRMIINLILGKDIIVYDNWHKEIVMIIGSDEEIIRKRFNYAFVGKNEDCIEGNEETGQIFYRER